MSTVIYYVEVNAICIVLLGLLLFSLPRGPYQNRRGRLYKTMLLLTMLLCASDMAAGACRGCMFPGASLILWASNIMFLISGILVAFIWVLYSVDVLGGKLKSPIVYAAGVISLAACLIVLSAPFNGLVFTIDKDNIYHRGAFMWIYWAATFPYEIFPSLAAPFTKAEKNEKKAVALFIVLPLITTVLQAMFYGVTAVQTGIAGGLLLLYVMLQAKEVSEARIKADIFDELSSTDTLTKLHNRRAYDTCVEAFSREEWVGAVFLDVNGLKMKNDTLGHDAGDELLRGFADFLRSCFEDEWVFRISGDEFVVLCPERSRYEECMNTLRAQIGDRASFGAADGPGKDTPQLVKTAESLMYEDKHRYYIRTGLTRRTT